jgi:2-methylcitrate dehydratase PrpD
MTVGPTVALGRHVASLTLDGAPAVVRDRLKTLLLDHVGCALGGSRTPLARMAAAVATASGGDRAATVVGTDDRAAPGPAAFANATAANALDYDDTGVTGHPGATIIAAALAVAESRHLSGAALLEAMLAGYEVWSRISGAILPSWEGRRRVYGSGVTQTFGAAAAVARLVGLTAEQTVTAFGLAGAFAPLPHEGKFGWEEGRVSWVKDNVAWPAEGGIRAALLAAEGFRATGTILEGERGLWLMAGSDRCDFERMTRGLGQEYEVLRMSLKPYPCCRWIHSTLDIARDLAARHRIRPEEVERVTVRSIEAFRDWFAERRPATLVDAQFSVPHAVAMALLDRPRVTWWHEASRQDAAVETLMDRVELETDPAAQAAYATLRDSARIPATVTIDTPRGRFEGSRPGARGGPADPLSREEIEMKYRELAEPVLGLRRAAAVPALIEKLESLGSIDELMAAVTPEPPR